MKQVIEEICGGQVETAFCGPDCYQVTSEQDTSMKIYLQYLTVLKKSGYVLYVDNQAAKEISEYVKTATYTKGHLVVTVTHVVKTSTTYLFVCENQPLSKYLHFDESYLKDGKEGAVSTLHNLQLYRFGACQVIQLKNGHFIVNDGGLPFRNDALRDTQHLIDYLNKWAPNGEKPVIEAWMISHLHRDHCGVIKDFADGKADASCFYVEGFYYNEPHESAFEMDKEALNDRDNVKLVAKLFKTTEGKFPELYRIQTGQRYYFHDITMDIVHTQEQHPLDNWESLECPNTQTRANFNESSSWYMFNIEGQKVLFTGDADKGSIDYVMSVYSPEYLRVTVVTAPHHGYNPYQPFSEFVTPEVILVPEGVLSTSEHVPQRSEWYAPNSFWASKAKEVLGFKDGTNILRFPYNVGESETAEKYSFE